MNRMTILCAIVYCAVGVAGGAVMPGTWDTTSSDLQTGTWLETYGPTGPGHAGCELAALADDATQWMMGGIQIVTSASGTDNGDGTITYTTDYYSEADPGTSYLMLAAAPTLWGDAVAFTNLFLTVEATIDAATGDYLGGIFYGSADTAAGMRILMNGTLSRTGILGDPPTGHEGTVDYLEVTIEPAALSMDIKPGSCPNPLNTRSRGVLPVALLGTDTFDVMDVDVTTLRLARADGLGTSVAPLQGPPGPKINVEDVGTPYDGEPCDCHDVMGDTIDDLTMKFRVPELVDAFLLADVESGTMLELTLTGNLMDGTPLAATDCARIKVVVNYQRLSVPLRTPLMRW